MKKPLKITAIVVATVLVLLVGIAVLAKILITPERVKNALLPRAEKALHRQVLLGEVEVSIFSGIVLKDLTVREREGEEPFVKAVQARLRYQFWPLLSKRVVIDEIALEAPQIRVVKLPDGTFNYSDMITKKEPSEEKATPQKEMDLLVSTVTLTDGRLHYEDRTRTPAAAYDVSGIQLSSSDIALDRPFPFTLKGETAGIGVKVDGKLSNAARKPAVDAEMEVTIGDLRKTGREAPPELADKLKKFDPSGAITARLHLAGPVATPKDLPREGEVRLNDVQVALSGQRPVVAGELILKGKGITSRNLTLTSGPNKLNIAFTVADLLAKPLAVASNVTAERFDLDPFLKKGTSPAGATDGRGKAEPGPLNLPLRATGTVQVGQTAYKGLAVTRLNLKYRLADNILTVEQLSGNVAGGSFSGTSQIDLGRQGFSHATKLSVQGVQAEPVVAAFAPKANGTVFGTMSLTTRVTGKGIQSQSLKNNLSGDGTFSITNGKLTGAGLVQNLAAFVNLEQLRVLQFSKFGGDYRIDKGKVVIDSAVAGKDVQITPKGTAGLDKSLDLALPTRLSPELGGRVARGSLGKFITDDQGWTIVPLKVSGTFSSPSFRVDASAVREQVKTRAKEKIQQTIEEKLIRKQPGEPPRPEQEILEKGLRGIFGR